MELKINDLLLAKGPLEQLNSTQGMPSVAAYRISKNIKLVNEELKVYEEQRKNLCEHYANKDDDGKPIVRGVQYDIPYEFLSVINDELLKIREETVNIDIKKVSLADIDKAGLSPAQLETIEFMLDILD